ncbi:MAG: hypothetical protein D6826_08980 [Alphaproteobacteria bacterium]|nr:MAG: hypothetical protein D6826_08980 [Alphaproteobacteria bacterium]
MEAMTHCFNAWRLMFVAMSVVCRGVLLGALIAVPIGTWAGEVQATPDANADRAHGPDPDEVIVTVDGAAITVGEFDIYFRRYLRQKLYHGGSPERVRELRNEAMARLIDDKLVLNEAIRRQIPPDTEAVDMQMAALKERYGNSARWSEFEPRLPAMRAYLLERSRINVLRRRIESGTALDEAQVRAFYEANPDLFTEPPAFHVAVILIDVPPWGTSEDWRRAQKKAEGIHARILAGEDFAALAKEFSRDKTAQSGGDMGFVHDGQLAPEVQKALDSLSVGETTAPVRVLEGYALFRLLGERPAHLQPFEVVRERAKKLALRTQREKRWQQLLSNLRANAQITFNGRWRAMGEEGTAPLR